jgi:predicted DCC family thiol-disulfide oxidoreductase YuxK
MTVEQLQELALQHPILFFDGHCALCNNSVKFLLKWDKTNQIYFAPLQGPEAQTLLEALVRNVADSDSLIVLNKGKAFYRTDGLITLGPYLPNPYRFLMKALEVVPSFLRNGVYRFISKIRYAVWGKTKEFCPIISPSLRHRFLHIDITH